MGRKFYIILDGKVLVLIPQNNETLLSSFKLNSSAWSAEEIKITNNKFLNALVIQLFNKPLSVFRGRCLFNRG